MFIPINTDAPLYHFPWMTIGLIVLNAVCFAVTGAATDYDRLQPWLLEYGHGLNPFEWFTAAFAHAGFGHLLGNMFFLWGFGIVVEGKLGWRRFLMLYLGLIAAWGCGVDVLTLHRTDGYVLRNELDVESLDELTDKVIQMTPPEHEPPDRPTAQAYAEILLRRQKGACLGASGVIYALMAMALVWAPKNEIHLVGWFFFRFLSFEVTIMTFALWYFALGLFGVLFGGFQMDSSGLHMIGAGVGFAVGTLYLKRGWVDCENWDLFAVMAGTYGRFGDKDWALGAHGNPELLYGNIPVPEGAPEDAPRQPAKSDKALTQINALIDDGDMMAASGALIDLRLTNSTSLLDHARLKRFCHGLLKANAWDEAEIALDEYIERFPGDAAWARVRAAQILLSIRKQPRAARQMLKPIRKSDLNSDMLSLAKQIAATARKQISAGVPDAEPEW
jgi:membrane associated rhomboid family serine protease